MACPKRKHCEDEVDSKSDEAPPPKRRVPLLPPTVSPSSLKDALTDPKDAIAVLTPALQTKLLEKLLADPSASPTVACTLTFTGARAAASRARMSAASAGTASGYMEARTANGDGVDMTDLTDYVGAAQPLLADVARLARVPCPGAAREAYAEISDILELVFATDPEEEDCTIDAPEKHIPFDKVANEMLLAIAERREREEGAEFVVGDELGELKYRAAAFEQQLGFERWFAKAIAFLEAYAAGR
ncbi:hypothetical protein TRAPUB_2827 [Trametes pubescens]|uniref:Uncharacterized protein n=1 Tax=Trametes pubescens TaxID=154538 RepID=A0A1M2VFD9_TRAPU|nr:hypothetical protein TRAPUB_2827 [Trametes pubescens]